ncbi:MAG TPA: hypothetical protein VGM93_01045, partial [Acidimicrobiales bacterium]
GIDGCQAHALAAAAGRTTRERTEPHRGWSADDWDAAVAGLADRGLAGADGAATAEGRAFREEVERSTDAAAMAPLDALGEPGTRRLIDVLRPFAAQLFALGILPPVNPIGLPPTDAPQTDS